MKTKIFIFFLSITSLCLLAQTESLQGKAGVVLQHQQPHQIVQSKQDTLNHLPPKKTDLTVGTQQIASNPALSDSLSKQPLVLDSTQLSTLRSDTLKTDSAKKSKSVLDAPVIYSATDSIIYDAASGRADLFGEGNVDYLNLKLKADLITMALDSSLVHASGRADSTGKMRGEPVFKQGEDQYDPERISYNFKTQKAYITNVFTKQGDGFLVSEQSKRSGDGVMFVKNGRYTTCDAKHPHFYMALTYAKVRPGKDVVFGPAYLVVEDVPLPLAIPYGFFPFSKKYSSGIIMPSYGDETSRGFYLRDGGYYFAVNDLIDLKLTGEIYTKGSWGINLQSNYRKRYRYSGNFLLSYQNTIEGEKNMPDYAVTKSFKVQWAHRQDGKANPSQSFSSSVNFASQSYERNNLNSMYNPESYSQSTRTSSINYSKTFQRIGLTLSGTFNLSQNMHDSSLAVTLPSLNISLARLSPFKRKKMAGEEQWYEKIALSYTGTFSNSITCKEDVLFKSNLIKDWRNGMRHSVPISATFNVANFINITPSITFTDRMYTNKILRKWDDKQQREVNDTLWGFNNVYDYNLSLTATTKLYGFYKPLPQLFGHKIQTIRHVFTPTIGFNYSPDFGAERFGYWDSYVKTDKEGNVSTVTYSPYSNSLYGVPGRGMTGSLSMDVSNNVEMKIRTDKDSTGYRKISLIDELGANMNYNMAAQTHPWSDLNLRVRVKLTKSYTFSMNARFATYAYEFDENGNVRSSDKTEYSFGRFGRFQGMSQNLSYTFNNRTLKKWFGKESDIITDTESDEQYNEDDEFVDSNSDPELEASKNSAKTDSHSDDLDEDGYLKFQLPWSFTVSYGVSMSENTGAKINPKNMRYPYKLTHTMNFSGNLRISEGWNINFSSGYDFNYHRLSMTTASLTRDLHCFQMSASVVLSPYTSYNFTFSADASALSDVLKWKKQSSYSSNIDWY